MDEQLGLTQLKECAATLCYTKIRRQRPGTPALPLATWNGYSTEAGDAYNHVSVWYVLKGDNVTVYKAGKPEEDYTLS
jgi:hypothetical protein